MPAGGVPAKKAIAYVVIRTGDRPTFSLMDTSSNVIVIPIREADSAATVPELVIPVAAPKKKPRPYPEHLARPPWERRRR